MRDPKEFRERFLRWKNGENYWEQRGINMNTQQSLDLQADLLTPEQLTAIETALEYYTSGKDSVDYVPPETANDDRPNLFLYSDGRYVYQLPGGEETQVTPTAISQSMYDDPQYWTYADADGKRYTPKNTLQKQDRLDAGREYIPVKSEIDKYFNELAYRAKNDPSSIALLGKYILPAILAPALGLTAFNLGATPYINSALTSYFTADGLNDMMLGKIDWETALKLSSAGELYTPFKNIGKSIYNKASDIYRDYRINKKYWSLQNAEKPIYYTYFNDKKIPPASITPDTMADVGDFSYKGPTSDVNDLIERMVYNDKIHGKPTYLFEQSIQTGIPETEYNELLHDVVGRNVREFKQAGLDDAQINAYIDNAKNAMDNVRIGMYSDLDYKKAGMERIGGFYDNKGNFISINTGSTYTKPKIVKHEGRHLLDHKVDDELLMPTSNNFVNDFDSDIALSTMQKVKQNQNMILYDAYDNDFVTLPSKKGFNEGLEEYLFMDREAITTNLDARNELLGRKASWDLNITDKIIDRVSDSAIFEAVEKANGYGRRYIRFLRENNKLTPKKAKQFREAMKHVGAIAAPMGVVGLGARISSDQKNTYNRGKDKNEPTVVGRKYISDIKKQNPVYYDIMKRVGQENYQDWGFPSAYEATAHALKDTDYDYKGYYDKYPESGANSQTHWNDEYKGVLHPTFSDESIYHNVQNDTYNPYGLRGGIWIGDRFIALPYQNPFNYFNRGKDKGIHINPKNRGKFNALKKRTGKTTEQLTHSKNPLTRKRAIFAKMAKRGWKPLKKSK